MRHMRYLFQSTLPRRERRRIRTDKPMILTTFQSTLPRRERRQDYFFPGGSRRFQSTLPRRERRIWQIHGTGVLQFQSTLPRRERHPRGRKPSRNRHISIHAPAKGATRVSTGVQSRETQFQSTLPRRERRIICGCCCSFKIFQSTLPRRERQKSMQ